MALVIYASRFSERHEIISSVACKPTDPLARTRDIVIKLQLKIPPTRAAFYRRAMFYSYPIVKRLGIARTKDREVISRCFREMTDLKNEGPIARRHYGTSTVNRRRPTDPTDELHWPNLHSIGVRQRRG
uniref:Uncharacterized protein n=1 Tax=Vespula pensylvanica TaxID=30213 RepID=A0A834PC81_VESPE|nr:hypothetical protein H0235_003607 [Vespula pensylvanica]